MCSNSIKYNSTNTYLALFWRRSNFLISFCDVLKRGFSTYGWVLFLPYESGRNKHTGYFKRSVQRNTDSEHEQFQQKNANDALLNHTQTFHLNNNLLETFKLKVCIRIMRFIDVSSVWSVSPSLLRVVANQLIGTYLFFAEFRSSVKYMCQLNCEVRVHHCNFVVNIQDNRNIIVSRHFL